MNPIAVLKRVSLKNIFKVIWIGLSHPFFIMPTIKATRECIKISSKTYGKLHHKNGPANAFRHALWNYLIAKRCQKWSKDDTKAMLWAQKITDWHELAFPNTDLARKMDFHNNEIGRQVFVEHPSESEHNVVFILKEKTKESTKVDESSIFTDYKNQLVHIVEHEK